MSREQSREQSLNESSACLGAWLADSSPSPAERASADEQAVRLARAIEALPEAQRDAVVLHYWQGRTTAEVAEQIDLLHDKGRGE